MRDNISFGIMRKSHSAILIEKESAGSERRRDKFIQITHSFIKLFILFPPPLFTLTMTSYSINSQRLHQYYDDDDDEGKMIQFFTRYQLALPSSSIYTQNILPYQLLILDMPINIFFERSKKNQWCWLRLKKIEINCSAEIC